VVVFVQPPFVSAAESPEIHYAPAENLERFAVALLRAARSKIDLAAYVLTDWPVIDALIDAASRSESSWTPVRRAISIGCERCPRACVQARPVLSCI
jgi:phosphatidylserine/phosphatidylglycerophosphate/cardiolipin synthase-like enzyme